MNRGDFAIPLAVAALVCLVTMLTITAVTGISQETFEVARPAAQYAADLRAHDGAVRALFAVDSAFLVIYATYFLVFGRRVVTDETRALITVGTVFILITAFLDMVEDHHILAMLAAARGGADPSAAEIVTQHVISQVKFNVSYLALFLFGLALPRGTTLGLILSLLLTVGTLVQGVWLYLAPASLLPAGNIARGLGYVLAFALSIPFLRTIKAP
jgi:hypothetical protein